MKCSGTLKVSVKPVILIDPVALNKARYMVRKHPKECQWWHQVTKQKNDNVVYYYLHDFLVPEQLCSGADVESDPVMIQKMYQDLRGERNLSLEELSEVINSTNCWCHSHVNIPASPSAQDDKQWKEQKELSQTGGSNTPRIMLILNKKDEYYSKVFDPELDIEFENVSMSTVQDVSFHSEIDEIIKTKLKIRPIVVSKIPTRHSNGVHWDFHEYFEELTGSQSQDTSKKKEDSLPKKQRTTSQEPYLPEKYLNSSLDYDSLIDYHIYSELQKLSTDLSTSSVTKSLDVIEEIIKVIDDYIELEDYKLLTALIFDCDESIRLIPSWLDQNDNGDYKGEFIESCINLDLQPPEIIADAIDTLLSLKLVQTEEELEDLLDTWIELRVEEVEGLREETEEREIP